MNGKLKILALTAAISAVISTAGLGLAKPAGAQVTIQQDKAGYATHFQDQANLCGNLFGAGYIDPIDLYLSRTPYVSSRAQTVRMFTRIEYLTSSGWAPYTQDAVWQERTFRPDYDWELLSTKSFSVARGHYYRVKQFYEWWVNGVRVGTATNLFNQSEYFASWVAPTGTAASYCYIY
jgi:hypothetical protein